MLSPAFWGSSLPPQHPSLHLTVFPKLCFPSKSRVFSHYLPHFPITTFSHCHIYCMFFSHYFPLFTTFSHYLPSIFHPLLDSLCPPTPGRAIRAKHAKQNWGNSHIPSPGGFTPLMSHFPRLQTSPDPTRPPNQRFGTPWARDKARPV